jgi:hypothetical protein
MQKQTFIGIIFADAMLVLPLQAHAQSGTNRPEAVDIDPELQIWLQLPMTTVPVMGGVHFVIVDVLIKQAQQAAYVCRMFPRLNEKIQFAFSGNPPVMDRKSGEFAFHPLERSMRPDFNEALQDEIVRRVNVFDGAKPKPKDEDIAIMECQGSAAILRAKTQLRDLLRRQH